MTTADLVRQLRESEALRGILHHVRRSFVYGVLKNAACVHVPREDGSSAFDRFARGDAEKLLELLMQIEAQEPTGEQEVGNVHPLPMRYRELFRKVRTNTSNGLQWCYLWECRRCGQRIRPNTAGAQAHVAKHVRQAAPISQEQP